MAKPRHLVPTSASDWAPKTVVKQLPSGKIAELQPVGLDFFINMDHIPDSLTPTILEMFNPSDNKVFAIDTKTIEGIKKTRDFLDLLCIACFVTPKVVDSNPDYVNGEISVRDISLIDKEAVMEFFNAPATALTSFREKQTDDVVSLDGSEVNGPQSE